MQPPRCLIVTNDLMAYSRLGQTVRAAGCDPVQVRDGAALADAAQAPAAIAAIIDLSGSNTELVRAASDAGLYTVAVGPHVQTDLLEAARRAGADDVLPHSATGERLRDLLQDVATAVGEQDDPGAHT